MPFQLHLCSSIIRLFTICLVLFSATHTALPPAFASPTRDDAELTVTAADDADESATEPTTGVDGEAVEPASDEDEPATHAVLEAGELLAEPAPEVIEATEATAEPELAEADATAEPEADTAAEPEAEDVGAVASSIDVEEAATHVEAPVIHEVAAAPAPIDDEVDDLFLRRLLDAINQRRADAGSQRLVFIPARANAALEPFLAETAPGISWPGPCGHNPIDGAFSWDYVLATGFGGSPRGEVIACPGPEPYWTPDRAAAQWWDSPIHHDVLYADRESNAIACSAYGVKNGNGKKKTQTADAASAVLCVTFRD